MRACLLALAVLTLVPSFAAAAPREDAAEIVAAIGAVEFPKYDRDRRGEEGYMDEYYAQREAAEGERAELILELFGVDPSHEDLLELMPVRWEHLIGNDNDAAVAEMDGIILTWVSDDLVSAAFFYKAEVAKARRDADAMELATGAFRRAFPEDDRAARMLEGLARMLGDDSERMVAAYRDLVESYPDYRGTKYARGKIRQVELMGKPFELSFEDAISGDSVSMADLRGKVVVVDFWATWCGPCIAEMPTMKELYAEFAPQGVEFVGVSLDRSAEHDGLEKLRNYVDENDIGWPQYYQGNYWDSEFSSGWGINSIPALFAVDRDGNLASVKARGQLETLLPELLGIGE